MKKNQFKIIYQTMLAVAGAFLTAAAFFARQLRLDNNDQWGNGRFFLLFCGAGLWCLLAWSLTSAPRQRLWLKTMSAIKAVHSSPFAIRIKNDLQKISAFWRQSALVKTIQLGQKKCLSLPGLRWLASTKERQAVFWAILGLAFTITVYLWLATAGTWVKLTPGTGFIDMQARGYLNGYLHLVETPPPDLLALSNPYDIGPRVNMKYIWDASVYGGQYYLYWGPIPAVLEALFRGITHIGLGDEVYGFCFLVLLVILETAWILFFRKTFFPNSAPIWMALWVPLAGLVSPLSFSISGLSIYVVSIISAQVFLMGGLFLIRHALTGRVISLWRWFASGALLGMAVVERTNLMLVVAWIGFYLLGMVWVGIKSKRTNLIKHLMACGLGLALVLTCLMSYNYARFKSPTESGFSYQLTFTSMMAQAPFYFSPPYVLPNAYVYLFRPVTFRHEFPFIYSTWLTVSAWPGEIRLPNGYLFTDPVDGLFFTSPFILLALLPFWRLLSVTGNALQKKSWLLIEESIFFQDTLLWLFSGTGLVAFMFLLVFFYPVNRYLSDAFPSLMLLAVWGSWHWLENGRTKWLKTGLIIILAMMTILCGFLLCINGTHNYFEEANPGLYYQLIGFFGGK